MTESSTDDVTSERATDTAFVASSRVGCYPKFIKPPSQALAASQVAMVAQLRAYEPLLCIKGYQSAQYLSMRCSFGNSGTNHYAACPAKASAKLCEDGLWCI